MRFACRLAVAGENAFFLPSQTHSCTGSLLYTRGPVYRTLEEAFDRILSLTLLRRFNNLSVFDLMLLRLRWTLTFFAPPPRPCFLK